MLDRLEGGTEDPLSFKGFHANGGGQKGSGALIFPASITCAERTLRTEKDRKGIVDRQK